MTALRPALLFMAFAALLLTVDVVQASNLRNGSGKSVAVPEPPRADSADKSDHVIETQSSVEDASAPAAGEASGVQAWTQCGGLYYLGETQCAQHTFCKKISDFISVCFPESRPTE